MKRNRILLLATLLAVVLLVVLFFFKPEIFRRKGKVLPITALPESALFFFQGKDFDVTYRQFSATSIWKDLLSQSSVRSTDSIISIVFQKVRKNNHIFNQFRSEHTIISLHQTSPGSIEPLLIMVCPDKFLYEEMDALLKPEINGKLQQRVFQGVKIYDYQLSTRKSQLGFAITDQLLIISSNPLLIEDAITAIKKNRVAKNYYFKQVLDQKPNVCFFINYKLLGSFLNIFVDPESQQKMQDIKNFGSLGSYEFTYNDEFQFLRGNISNMDSADSYLSIFRGQTAGKMDVQKILSSNTSVLLAYNVNNLKLYYENYLKRLKNIRQGRAMDQYNRNKARLEAKYNISLVNELIPLLDGPYALALDEVLANDIASASSVFIKVTETEKAMEMFYQPSINIDTFKTGLIEKYREFDVYGSQLSEVFSLLYGNAFSGIGYTYYANIRDYLIFCPSLSHLHSLIDDYLAQKLLGTSSGFVKMYDKIGSESNLLFYINPILANHLPEIYANNTGLSYYQNNISYFRKFEFFAFQLSNSSSGIYSEIAAKYSKTTSSLEGGTVWETNLDTNYTSKPFVVKNHNTGANELIVFDALNKMYLIDAAGKILWKKQLDAPLVGDVYQVDYFDNDKLQYIFTTEKNIQLIDRNGVNVANFPLRLQAKSTSGLSMFDFSRNNDFIFFTGCSNGNVYGYAKTGKPLVGWSPKKIKGNLSMPLKYFMINGKTYYLGVSNTGVFYLTGNRGEDITKPLDLKTHFENPFYLKPGDQLNKTVLISADTNGKCFFVSGAGKADIQQLGKWSSAMSLDYIDINNDGLKELVFAEGNTVASFSTEGKVLNSIILDNPILGKPTFLNIKGKNYIAYLNGETQSVFLVDYEGNIFRNFPISCQSKFIMFDMNNDGNTDLIGGKGNSIFLARF